MNTTLFERARSALAHLLAWRWAKPAGRVAGAGIALAVLAVIGRATLAGAASPTMIEGREPPSSAPSAEETALAESAQPTEARVMPVMSASASPVAVEPSSLPLAQTDAPEPSADDMGDHPSARGRVHHRPATTDDPVYLNEATVADLQRLPNVGLKRANAILALRERLGGRFQQIEQLMKVRGMGAKAMKRLRPLMRLDRTAAADAGATRAG
jgi:competence protein ComEA